MGVLEYRRAKRWRVPWGKLAAVLIALIVVGWLVFADYAVDDIYVCQECGARVVDRHWYGIGWLTTRRETPSAVSEVLAAHGVGAGHVHRLVFFSEDSRSLAGSRGYGCATGREMGALLSNAHCAGGLLDNLYSYGDARVAEMWRRRLLDLSTSRRAEEAWSKLDNALKDGVVDKFETKTEFDLWWGEAGAVMEGEFVAGGK